MATDNYQLIIKGMHCAACSTRIEKVVGGLDGVQQCTVNLATNEANIAYDGDLVSQVEIEESIATLGFEPVVLATEKNMDLEAEAQEQLEGLRGRLIPCFILAAIIMIISMGPMVGLTLPQFLDPSSSPLFHTVVQFLLVLPVLYLGQNFYTSGLPALIQRRPNMDSLIALGTGAAVIYSTWNLIEIILGHNPVARAHDLYYESAAMLIALISLGKYLETRSKVKTGEAIRALMQLTPETATRIDSDGAEKQVPVELLEPGDIIILRPGERVAVDGVVVSGSSYLDESMLTGESVPVLKNLGENIFGGTLNTAGSLQYKAKKIGSETMLSRIVSLVREAQGTKAPIASLADRVSLYFVPVVITIALCSGFAWFFVGDSDFSFALRITIAVLVIACPCAMGLATPTSIMVGTGRGAQLGVLIKNGEVLEKSKAVDCVVFDKTGTITLGKPRLTELVSFTDYSHEELLRIAAAIEARSEHPLATAILDAAEELDQSDGEIEDFEAVPGRGLRASFISSEENGELLLGNRYLLQKNGIDSWPKEYEKEVDRLSQEGQTVLYLALNKRLLGLLAVSDPIKPEASDAVATLQKMGVRVIMLTGDNEQVAKKIAKRVGITDVIAGVLPTEKASEIKKLQAEGNCVAMVGDGINDAPALALADVGMAMGTGIDVAMESADIVLMNGNLEGVVKGLGLSRATMANIRQNLFWAFIYNIVGIPIAAGLLTLFGGPSLNPMFGGAAMAMSSVSVVTNALRLRFYGETK